MIETTTSTEVVVTTRVKDTATGKVWEKEARARVWGGPHVQEKDGQNWDFCRAEPVIAAPPLPPFGEIPVTP